MNACAFCGRDNLVDARFCIDCGKELRGATSSVGSSLSPTTPTPTAPAFPPSVPIGSPAMASVIPMTRAVPFTPGAAARCAHCGVPIDPSLPYCAGCGERVGSSPTPTANCSRCFAGYDPRADLYCSRCGLRLPTPATNTAIQPTWPVLSLLGESGESVSIHSMDGPELLIGRVDAALRFPDDVYLSPMHARLDFREGQLWIRDLGSRNGTWVFVPGQALLADGDRMLIGSQILRFRRLGYPGPHPPEADATRRMGSLVPSADVAILEQLRADGSVRDTLHLSPGRVVALGRETGDWLFPYDQTMSGLHAEVRAEGADFYLSDLGSRNGVAIAVRGERPLQLGQRIMLGDQLLRVESL